MERVEKISTIVGLITAIPILLSILFGTILLLGNLDAKIQFLILLFFLILGSTISTLVLVYVRRLVSPSKQKIIRAFNEPDTYIFLRGEWRKIPDWQTRDYLAQILGFRLGEEDIEVVSKDFVRRIKVGAPLESILTYSR